MIQRSSSALLRVACASAFVLLASASAPADTAKAADPDHLIVLSTTDVKGKTSPCGCHTPKGGYARRMTFVDSVRTQHSQVLLVDAGGYFPESDTERDAGPFSQRLLKRLGTDAVGVGDRDLRFGFAFLRDNARAAGLPLVCANLYERKSGRLAFAPYILKRVGNANVGIFGLITDKADLGPGRDSLQAEDPMLAATRTIAELKRKGATVIVLLSQLGKVEGEDIVTAVEGVDAVILGRDVPMLQKGRMVKHTVACYGGEQGWYVGLTAITLDGQQHMASADNDTYMLGPDVATEPGMLASVKQFEDALNDRLRLLQKETQAQASLANVGATEDQPDHFLGVQVCARCHTEEYEQWKQTPHAHAWATLVEQKKDATPECVKCHVLAYQQAGGFHTEDDAAMLANVQCENCHGMGTQHEAMRATPAVVSELTCRGCHDGTSSPTFSFADYRPHILHHPPADLKPLPESPAKRLMREQGGHASSR